MPLYSYKCRKCGNEFELLLPMHTDHGSLECPDCKEKNPERIFFGFSCGSSCNSASRFS